MPTPPDKPLTMAADMIARSRCNESSHSVTTSRFLVEFVLNEQEPDNDNAARIKELEEEIQRAMDAGFFTGIRCDGIAFEVLCRNVLDVAPPGSPE